MERIRRVASAAALAARQRRLLRTAFLNRGLDEPNDSAQAIAEGLVLASYSGDIYKSGERSGPPAEQARDRRPAAPDAAGLERAVERGRILAESCNIARDLCNEPSNVLTPSVFADRAAAIGRECGLAVEILDEDELARRRMGLLLGVARGSAEPPRMIVLRHDPPGAPATPVLGLVGKGVTFDTGGISIKPADGMEKMKDDMAGGAAVVAAMRAIALLNAPISVIGVVPTVENMPGSKAIKPGDVLTGAGGKTVEVINTDAEGRLILGDGLWYAQELGATHLVDVATLTGACVVALGRAASGLFGQPEAWIEVIQTRQPADRRPLLADAALRGVRRPAPQRDRRHDERRRTPGRRLHGGDVPQGIRRRPAVGPSRHRRHGLDRRCQAVAGERPDRGRRAGRLPSWRLPATAGSEQRPGTLDQAGFGV